MTEPIHTTDHELAERECLLEQRERRLEESEHELADELKALDAREHELADELHSREEVETVVSFPLSLKPPYRHETPCAERMGAVLAAAMTYFEVSDSSTTVYKLAHGGEPVDPAETVGYYAGHEHKVKFTLAKELVQG